MTNKKTDPKTQKTRLREIISKVESLLDTEIDNLPQTLKEVPPEKRLDFVTKLLPVLIKYREDNSEFSWDLPSWE